MRPKGRPCGGVAPHVGAWIETNQDAKRNLRQRSHPMWVRGLKLTSALYVLRYQKVAPHVGAWIETKDCCTKDKFQQVAPHVGAWIET